MKPPVWIVLANLFLVYISWGSTYIGLKLTLEVLGPFSACGARMGLGGLLLCLWLILRGRWRRPTRADLRHAALFGLVMVVMASGFLSKGQVYIDSTIAAVVTGSTPITMLLAAWLFAGEDRPGPAQCFGLAAGFVGLVLLGFSNSEGGVRATPGGIAWVLSASFAWVGGSLAMRRRPFKTGLSAEQSCALLLALGGLESVLLGLACGEAEVTRWANLRPAVLVAFSWMVIGGAIIAYSCYFWLLTHTTTAVAISYEYVVPVIGLFLGWWIGGETVSAVMIFASCLTLGSAFLVMRHKRQA